MDLSGEEEHVSFTFTKDVVSLCLATVDKGGGGAELTERALIESRCVLLNKRFKCN